MKKWMNDRNKRKLLAAGMALCLAASLLSACKSGGEETEQTSAETESESVPAGTQAESTEESAAQPETDAGEPTLPVPSRAMEEIQEEESIGIFSGTVEEETADQLLVSNEAYPEGIAFVADRTLYSAELMDVESSLEAEAISGREVTVFYRGDLEAAGEDPDEELPSVVLVREARDGDETRTAGEVSGEVLGMGMSVITIRTDEGQEISFEQDPRPVNATDGPMEGERVTILYSEEDGGQWYVPELILDAAE